MSTPRDCQFVTKFESCNSCPATLLRQSHHGSWKPFDFITRGDGGEFVASTAYKKISLKPTVKLEGTDILFTSILIFRCFKPLLHQPNRGPCGCSRFITLAFTIHNSLCSAFSPPHLSNTKTLVLILPFLPNHSAFLHLHFEAHLQYSQIWASVYALNTSTPVLALLPLRNPLPDLSSMYSTPTRQVS